MPKFVPRQRKHKVLARTKQSPHTVEPEIDSNAIEHISTTKVELEEKKRRLKEELQNKDSRVSGKKAKRLEKYIESKLRKDENRELIEKLTGQRVDTSLYQSSKKLGHRKETKREQLSQALRSERAGIDINGNNKEILLESRSSESTNIIPWKHNKHNEDENEKIFLKNAESFPKSKSTSFVVGTGLKRPLELDEQGKPLLKKRKKRGGIISKLISKHELADEPIKEPAWDGFSSTEGSESECDSESTGSEFGDGVHDSKLSGNETSPLEKLLQSDDDSNGEMAGEDISQESESEDDGEDLQKRSSAFKAWANQQRDEILGYKSSTVAQNATETIKIENFKPRPLEDDPLPLQLQPSKDNSRKAFSVSVLRPSAFEATRLLLPVVAEEQKIMEAIHNNSTVVVHGATGSGKTTQVPQFLYEAGYGSPDSPNPGLIGVTQPRRVAAVSMAKRVGDELGNHSRRVAYQIRFEGNTNSETAIKFMTDGVLLREVAQDIALRKYSAIVIDEAHERSANTDILIGMMSRVVRLREEMSREDVSVTPLKLVIMSATLRITDFTENNTLFDIPPPVIQAEGRQFPVTIHFARRTTHDYIEEAFRKISKGHRRLPPGGFLVFMTGQNEITHLSKRLKEAFGIGTSTPGPQVRISSQDAPIEAEDIDFGDVMDDGIESDYDSIDIELNDDEGFEVDETQSGPQKMHVLPLYSLLPTREQLKVFEPPPDGARMVVLATNVAETSLTIPGIRYVFDCGRSKERKYNRQSGVQSFEVGWISKASASQRAGRAGRTGPGHCYRMYSSAMYERDFEEFAEPEILRMPIEGIVLQLKAMNLQHVVNFPFPTPPDRVSLASSEKLLTYLSALSPTGQITDIGRTMSIFPLSPRFARILLIGHLHDCIQYTIAVVAGLSAAEVFIPENQAVPIIHKEEEDTHFTVEDRIQEDARNLIRRKFNKVQREFCSLDDRSDAIKLLQVVGEYAHEATESWCQDHFVRFKVLKEILQLRRQITDLLRTNIPAFAGLKFQERLDPPSPKQVKALKQMVAAGFIDHIAIRSDLAPTPPEVRRKPKRAIDVPYLTLFRSHLRRDEEDKAVYLHPSSPLAHLSIQELPDYISYSYLQRTMPSGTQTEKLPKTRMHALTDVTGAQLATLAKGTPLLYYGKPIKEVKALQEKDNIRECWVIPYLRAEATGGMGWPLPARKVTQRKFPGKGWVVE